MIFTVIFFFLRIKYVCADQWVLGDMLLKSTYNLFFFMEILRNLSQNYDQILLW